MPPRSAPGRGHRGPSRPSRGPARAARRPRGAGRPCPSGSGRDSAPARARRPPAARQRPPSRRRVRGRSARPGAERQLDRGAGRRLLPARGELEASREHRVHDDAVAIEHDVEELAQAPDLRDGLAGERLELGRRAADGQRHLRPRGGDRPVRQGGMEGVGDDVEVRQLGHGPRLYPPIPRARLSRPTGARTVEELCPVPSARRSGPPAKVTNDPSPSKTAPDAVRRPFVIPGVNSMKETGSP